MMSGPLVWVAVVTVLTGASSAAGAVCQVEAAAFDSPQPGGGGQPARTPGFTASLPEGAADGGWTNLVSLFPTPTQKDAASPTSGPATSMGSMEDPATAAGGQTLAVREHVPEAPTTVALRWENDLIAGTDEGYSNGMSLTVSRDGRGPLGWVWKWIDARERRWVTNYEVTQLLFTPRDLSRVVPDPTDVPYSGILVGSVATELAADDRLYGLKVVAGVRGPAAFGEHVQKAVHRLTGSRPPRGWSHQLPNHVVLNLTHEQRWRLALLRLDEGWEIQAIPRVAGSLGNALIEGQLGAQIRVGFRLPDDFGVTETRGMGSLPFPRQHAPGSEPAHGLYAFLGLDGHAVSRNITLDATSSTDGAHLEKTAALGTFQAGVVFWTGRLEAALAYIVRGREYDTQLHPARFASASLAFRF